SKLSTWASGSSPARSAPYRSARQPTAATLAPDPAAASSSSMDSYLAAWMKPQVFTRTTLASPSEVSSQPDAVSRAASSSESTSLRAQPSVTRLTVLGADSGCEDTTRSLPRGLGGLPRAEAQRHRHRAVGVLALAVHGENDPARVTQPDV